MEIDVTILGSGTSTGVPMIGCNCTVCLSQNPRNHRTRVSIYVQVSTSKQQNSFVVDTGPEFRLQMVREKVPPPVDYIYTHIHADHCHGFDDLRSVYFAVKKPLRCYAKLEFIDEIKKRFHYMFEDTGYQGGRPVIEFLAIPESGIFKIQDLLIETFSCPHGNVLTSIFKIGSFVYATDFKILPPEVIAAWTGKIHTMIASGIRYGTHHTHSTIEETVALFKLMQVKRGIITHLSHEVDYEPVSKNLPENIELAYDGMKLKINPQNI